MGNSDTTHEADQATLATLRRMPPEARLVQAFGLVSLTRDLVERGVLTRHPEYSPDQVRMAAIQVSLGEDLFRVAYPGSPPLRP